MVVQPDPEKDVIYVVTIDTSILFKALPEELKSCPHWVLWKREDRKGKVTKVPLQKNGKYAKSTDPKTWCSFEDAVKALSFKVGEGIGFVFTRDTFSGIDLDHCYDQSTGKIDRWAIYFLARFKSYTEVSPSGTGLHIIVKGSIPEGRTGAKKSITRDIVATFPHDNEGICYECGKIESNAAIEIYSEGRFFTVTGDARALDKSQMHTIQIDGGKDLLCKPSSPSSIVSYQTNLRALYTELFGAKVHDVTPPVDSTADSRYEAHTEEDEKEAKAADKALYQHAAKAKNGEKFALLFHNLSEDYEGDESARDLALCNLLAFWTQKDAVWMDRLFRQSSCMRPKWNEKRGAQTYGEMTITEAIDKCVEVYHQPPGTTIESPPAEIEIKTGNNILKRGKVLKFLVQQAQRNHYGDEGVLKILMASIVATNSAKSKGIFPDINGPPGGGKSDAALAAIFLVSDKWKSITSISSKALFYDDEMVDGMVIYSDDIEYSRELTATLKRSKGDFQHRQMHTVVNSVDGERKAEHKEMPCRIAWWLSSVESAADDQLKDRDYALDIDESAEHAEHVTDFINTSRASSAIPGNADWRIKVARYIIDQIKDHEIFRVKVDFATRVDWSLKKDHRSQNKFWDLVDAFTILNYQQRTTDEDGWLHATKEDFEEAKTCFLIRKMSHTTKLTNAQIALIQKVAALECEEGVTQAALADELHKSQQAVSLTLKSILGTPYITYERGAFGENKYHTTKVGLDYAYSSVKEIVVLREDVAA